MIPSNTICVSQEGPANALALNKDCTQVVIAGRNVFKVFSIGENEFSEVCNLRVGKNLNLNFSSIDVAWSKIEENTLATAATNGAVVVWNLGRSGRSKQEHVFSDHKRTVNKVSFHLTEPSLLISGSQDGMMKCFDLRMKEVARTFISNTESIRDVQFSPHSAHLFAAVSENGSVQLWDSRRHERPLGQHAAHSGPVFTCDWHPEMNWLATASRDKTIKVWDIQAKPTLEYTIYTIASVGHVKWRPQRKYQISSCALVLDCAVHVWDVRRPHVPLATFAEHRDVTTAIAWQADPHAFLSTSRDCSLYRHRFSEAAHPVLWAAAAGAGVSPRGDVCRALPARPLAARLALHAPSAAVVPTSAAVSATAASARHNAQAGRKQPTAGSLSREAQAELERLFPVSAQSLLTRWRPTARGVVPEPFLHCALNYKFSGAPVQQLAEHNAKVAFECDRFMTSHVWRVLGLSYAARRSPSPPRAPPHAPRVAPDPPDNYCAPEEETAEEEAGTEGWEEEWTEGWSEAQFHNSGVLGLPTHTIYVPPPRARRHDRADASGWVSAAEAHHVDLDAADWTLPEEAFLPRTALLRRLPAPPPSGGGGGGGGGSGGGGNGASTSPGSGSANVTVPPSYSQQSSVTTVESGPAAGLCVVSRWRRPEPAAAPLLAAALRRHAHLGDVQLPVCALLALQHCRTDLFPYIEESLQEQWLLGYIELLQRYKLYNIATEVIGNAWLGSVWSLSQQSTSVSVCCARCGRRALPCDRCAARPPPPPPGGASPSLPTPTPVLPPPRPAPALCALCRQVVRGLYAWCQGCSHGGHLHHMQQWMENHRECPAGCGHHCQL